MHDVVSISRYLKHGPTEIQLIPSKDTVTMQVPIYFGKYVVPTHFFHVGTYLNT